MDKKLQIFLVGCNHGIQPSESLLTALDSAEALAQRIHFRNLIEQIVRENAIKFIGEEGGDVETTFAETLAAKVGIRRKNINTSNTDKDHMGIPRDYTAGAFTREEG